MNLILPHSLSTKPVIEITEQELAWLAHPDLEDLLRKLNLTIVCKRCRHVLHGTNDLSKNPVVTAECACRKLRCRVKASA